MPIKYVTRLISKAFDRNDEEKAWQLYVVNHPNMTEEDFIPFKEFYKPNKQVEEARTSEDILKEVKELLSNNKGKWTA